MTVCGSTMVHTPFHLTCYNSGWPNGLNPTPNNVNPNIYLTYQDFTSHCFQPLCLPTLNTLWKIQHSTQALHKWSNKDPKLVKSTEHVTPADSNINLQRWKMNEYEYHDVHTSFPTPAGGLFPMELPRETEGKDEKYSRSRLRQVLWSWRGFLDPCAYSWLTCPPGDNDWCLSID